jgi:hypothetical protein
MKMRLEMLVRSSGHLSAEDDVWVFRDVETQLEPFPGMKLKDGPLMVTVREVAEVDGAVYARVEDNWPPALRRNPLEMEEAVEASTDAGWMLAVEPEDLKVQKIWSEFFWMRPSDGMPATPPDGRPPYQPGGGS